jgi:protein gp37
VLWEKTLKSHGLTIPLIPGGDVLKSLKLVCIVTQRHGLKGVEIWGAEAKRLFFGREHWYEPKKWDRESKNRRERRRVFSASMADILEDRRDLDLWRVRLWELVEDTPRLNWLLLTKRPENFGKMVPWGQSLGVRLAY